MALWIFPHRAKFFIICLILPYRSDELVVLFQVQPHCFWLGGCRASGALGDRDLRCFSLYSTLTLEVQKIDRHANVFNSIKECWIKEISIKDIWIKDIWIKEFELKT
jgi:hypothetical protein